MNAKNRFSVGDLVIRSNRARELRVAPRMTTATVVGFSKNWPEVVIVQHFGSKTVRSFHESFLDHGNIGGPKHGAKKYFVWRGKRRPL